MITISTDKTLEQLEMDAQIAFAAVEQKRKEERLFIMEEFFADHPEILTVGQYEAFMKEHQTTLEAYRALSAAKKSAVELSPEMQAQLRFAQLVKENTGITTYEGFEHALTQNTTSIDIFAEKADGIFNEFSKHITIQADGGVGFSSIAKYHDFQEEFSEFISELKRLSK